MGVSRSEVGSNKKVSHLQGRGTYDSHDIWYNSFSTRDVHERRRIRL